MRFYSRISAETLAAVEPDCDDRAIACDPAQGRVDNPGWCGEGLTEGGQADAYVGASLNQVADRTGLVVVETLNARISRVRS